MFGLSNLAGEVRKELTLGRIIASVLILPIIGGVLLWALGGWPDSIKEMADRLRDDWTCAGRLAIVEGDRLTDAASAEPRRAGEHLKAAIPHYEKAYHTCGFPDAGIRLAVAHCMGLGVPKNEPKARQYILEVEGRYEAKRPRAKDARQLCGFAL